MAWHACHEGTEESNNTPNRPPHIQPFYVALICRTVKLGGSPVKRPIAWDKFCGSDGKGPRGEPSPEMKDIYNVESAQESKKKKQASAQSQQSLQGEVDQEIEKHAQRLEEQNYKKAKGARMKLEKAAQQHKGTTHEMRRQGEKIKTAKKSAVKVHENAGEAGQLAEDIEKEGHMFNVGVPFWGRIKKWWKRDRTEEREVSDIKKGTDTPQSEYEEDAPAEASEEEFSSQEEEYIPGQKKTDSELRKILKGLKGVKKDTRAQSGLMHKQKSDLQEIKKVNEYSKKKVDKADEELKKGL